MSVRAMSAVWECSPAKGSELLLLLAIADAADDHGGNAWPSISTLAARTRLSTRTVQRLLDRLERAGLLRIHRSHGGRRSNSYTVIMTPSAPADPQRLDTDPPTGSGAEPSDPATPPTLSTPLSDCHPCQSDTSDTATSPHPRHSCDTPAVTQLRHRTPDTAMSPDPSYTRPITTLHPAAAPATGLSATDGGGGEGAPDESNTGPLPVGAGDTAGPVRAVLDQLGPDWPIGGRTAKRLHGPIARALHAGWEPGQLAAHLRANPDGVRHVGSVLAARLQDLPDPPRLGPAWCGICDAHSRLVELHDGRVARCGACHPLLVVDPDRKESA